VDSKDEVNYQYIYLDAEKRRAATILYKALTLAHKLYKEGEKDAERLQQEMVSLISGEPLNKIDYVSIADRETLEELSTINHTALVSVAVRIGGVRLIDNVLLL
jgi:pantoate--beta-alanine ligase